MNLTIRYFLKTWLLLLLTFTLSYQSSAQFEVYPSLNNWSTIELNVLDQTKTVEISALTSFPTGAGSEIKLYRYDSNLDTDNTVRLLAATNDNNAKGNYGSLRLDAYVETDPLFNISNDTRGPDTPVPSSAPYAMVSLVKHTSQAHNAPQDYSWNIGVYDEFEYNSGIGFLDEFDCQDCLTFAHQEGVGAVFYKYSFGSDANFQTASDASLKENIEDVKSTLEKLITLAPKNYHYLWSDKNPNRKSSGFLAQDVQKVFPELVSSIRQPNGEKTLMLNYIGLIPYITKGIQEQQEIIADQETTINNLESQLKQLSTQVKELKEIMEN